MFFNLSHWGIVIDPGGIEMISDVLHEALERIEYYQREMPDVYGHPQMVIRISAVKSAIQLVQKYLDMVPSAKALEGKDPEIPGVTIAEILNRGFSRVERDADGEPLYTIIPGGPEMTKRSFEGNFDGAPMYVDLLSGFPGSLDKDQKSHFEALGFDFERWNKTVVDLLEQLNWIRANIRGQVEVTPEEILAADLGI